MADIESKTDFKNTPQGQYKRWYAEFVAADKAHKNFYKQGDKVTSKYLNGSKAGSEEKDCKYKLNMFNANVNLIQALMFGKLPEIVFERTSYDPDDDVARVAGMMLERMLNADIGTPTDDYSSALRANLQDRLIPGLGISRVRYESEEREVQIDAIMGEGGQILVEAQSYTEVINESAPIDYVHWRDFKWSPCRRWEDLRWMAFRTYLDFDELKDRFGEEVARAIPVKSAYLVDEENMSTGLESSTDAIQRAEIWEIWSKETRQVIWFCQGYERLLDTRDDPLQLRGFFPTPEPMTANVTTSSFIPLADFILAQDLYNEIDLLETRIAGLTEAVKLVGVYDSSIPEIGRMFTEAGETELIPTKNFQAFAEKGGLKGSIDWNPIEAVAGVLDKLVQRRNDVMNLLYQITGIADIMRGANAAGGVVSATERALEARFASVKIQALQDEFARYATEVIRLRAEVVSKHFSPQTIVQQSNIEFTPDVQYIEPAIALIKDTDELVFRIQVKPESVAMVDYAQLKQERTEYITALATFLQSSAPLVQQEPAAAPVLLRLLQWGMAGFKGSQDVEGVLDQAITQINRALEQKAQNPQANPPSPEEIKAQMEQQKQQFEMQKTQMQMQMQQMQQEHQLRLEQLRIQGEVNQINLEAQKELQTESVQAGLNMEEKTHEADEKIRVLEKQSQIARDKPQGDNP